MPRSHFASAFRAAAIVACAVAGNARADLPLQAGLWSETRIVKGSPNRTRTFCKSDAEVANLNALLKGDKQSSMVRAGKCRSVEYTASGSQFSSNLSCVVTRPDMHRVRTTIKTTGTISATSYDVYVGQVHFVGARVGDCGSP